jgi:ETC complex I subunit conserved region
LGLFLYALRFIKGLAEVWRLDAVVAVCKCNHRVIMTARIFQPARSAMQSGEAKDNWLLEYEPEKPREIEPLMGWTSSSDMRSQVKLKFDSKEEAIAYAERSGIAYRVEERKPETTKILSYSDNFAPNRVVPWSH